MTAAESADVVVAGVGAAGAATLYQLARRGVGFKHSAAVGEHATEVLCGTRPKDPAFALGRPGMSGA